MKEDEIELYVEKYFGKDANSVFIPLNSAFDYENLLSKLSLAYKLDRPDLFYPD